MESDEGSQAREALASIKATRSGLADRLVTPWFYYPVLGTLMAGMALAYGLERFRDSNLRLLYALVVIAVCLWLVQLYARRTGVTITKPLGARSGAVFAVFATGLVGPLLWLIIAETPQSVVIGLAAFLVVFTILCGRAYDASLRADLRSESQ